MQLKKTDTNEAVKYFLEIWKRYMQSSDDDLGYPPKSSLFATGGIRSFEDLCESTDRAVGEIVKTIIEEMAPHHQAAIMHFNLHAVFRFTRFRAEDIYAEALLVLEIGLRKKGLL